MAPPLSLSPNGIAMCQTGNMKFQSMREGTDMQITCIGLDLAKTVFQGHGVDATGKAVLRKQIRRHELLKFLATLDRTSDCVIGMESCCGAEHWARALRKLGYDARIMNPSFVTPYVKGNKNEPMMPRV